MKEPELGVNLRPVISFYHKPPSTKTPSLSARIEPAYFLGQLQANYQTKPPMTSKRPTPTASQFEGHCCAGSPYLRGGGAQWRPEEGVKEWGTGGTKKESKLLSEQALKLYFMAVAYKDKQAGRPYRAQGQFITITTLPLFFQFMKRASCRCTDKNR